jgi:hypothetical protein
LMRRWIHLVLLRFSWRGALGRSTERQRSSPRGTRRRP